MKTKRKIVNIDETRCNGCGQCVQACAEGAIELVDGKARLSAEKYCDGLAACLGECPQGAIDIIEREADPFDPEAVEENLKANPKSQFLNPKQSNEIQGIRSKLQTSNSTFDQEPMLQCGCPSTQVETFMSEESQADQKENTSHKSELTHWPVQIKLVPPTAPFLKRADLLVVSDCVPVAYPNFHSDFVKGKVVMIGCPKFDDVDEYVGKFSQIFKTAQIKSVTIAIMEVPCCSKMPMIVRKALELSHASIPTEIVVVNAKGKILKRKPLEGNNPGCT